MGSIDIVVRDKDGKIKQDLHISRDKIKGKTVEVDLNIKHIRSNKIQKEVQQKW